jgi:hypothetical protein
MKELIEKLELVEKRLTLWHGSQSDDPRFTIGHTGNNSHTFGNYDSIRHGIFLTDNPEFAKIYGKPKKYVVYPQKTFDFNNSHHINKAEDKFLSLDSDIPNEIYNTARYTKNEWEWFEDDLGKYFVNWLKENGFDSASFTEYHDEDGKEIKSNTLVMLDLNKIRHDSGDQLDIHDKIYESTAKNINLLYELVDIFFDNFDIDYYKDVIERIPQIVIDNPYPDNMDRIEQYTDDDSVIKKLSGLTFILTNETYQFKDGDKETVASATYNPNTNEIKFYNVNNINRRILAHELRHLIQFTQYPSGAVKSAKDKVYTKQPIEIDAYWTDTFISQINYGIPKDKEGVLRTAKTIIKILDRQLLLSDKVKNHYYKKTIKGLVELIKMFHQGYEIDVDTLEKMLDQITLQKRISKTLSSEKESVISKVSGLIKRIFARRDMNMESIPNFDPTLEPSWSITTLSPPSKLLPRSMTKSDISYTILYLLLANRHDIIEVLWKAVKSLPKFKNFDIHDVITMQGDRIQDSRNEDAVHQFMFDGLKKYM